MESAGDKLRRPLAVSAVVHAVIAAVIAWGMRGGGEEKAEVVDVEIAPAPPKAEALPAEVARQVEKSVAGGGAEAEKAEPPPPPDETAQPVDAGVDAPIDAPKRKKRPRPDAAEEMAEIEDAGVDAAEADAGASVVASALVPKMEPGTPEPGAGTGTGAGSGTGAGTGSGTGSGAGAGSGIGAGAGSATGSDDMLGTGVGSGVAAATETGSGGVAGMDTQPAVDGAPTSAGTAANLLAYFPPGHVVSALVRFDRLRGSEWEAAAEKLFRPMPDYVALFGDRDAKLGDAFDTMVISTPRPRDATATTLVVHTAMNRAQVRSFLNSSPITWSAAKGGMLGRRGGNVFKGDKRLLLSPWKGWFVLAQPDDLTGLTAAAAGSVDAVEARAKLPPWLGQIRTIEKESGDEKKGPALVVTLAGPGTRMKFPDVGLGVTTLPSPQRVSLAMELVPQGWLVRGNIVFASEADATEFEQTATGVQQRLTGSHLLSALLKKQHVLNMMSGLSLARSGARVSYATSISIADARALLAAAAATLDQYFGRTP